MNNVLMRRMEVTAGYQPLASVSTVATVEISALPSNNDDVFFLGDDGSDVMWAPGEFHTLHRIDISQLQVKGTPGDMITIIGGTW